MSEQTKSQQIMALYTQGGRTMKQIAEIVGCHDAYVRVVARQRRGASSSPNEQKYLSKPNVMERARLRSAAVRARDREAYNAYMRDYWRKRREASHAQ